MSQPIEIQRKAIEHDIAVVKGRIGLQKAVLAGHMAKAIAERALVSRVVSRLIGPSDLQSAAFAGLLLDATDDGLASDLTQWCVAHQKDAEARENIVRLELAQLESQVVIWEAMLKQGEANIY